jgi:hypothetical protein
MTSASLESSVVPFPSIDQTVRLPNHSQGRSAPASVGNVVPAMAWAMTAALLTIAGAVAFDFLVLWIASARVIERLPF